MNTYIFIVKFFNKQNIFVNVYLINEGCLMSNKKLINNYINSINTI